MVDNHGVRPIVSAVAAVSGFVLSVEWSPDDSTIVVSGTDSTMGLFDARTLQRIRPPTVMPRGDRVEANGQVPGGAKNSRAMPSGSRNETPEP